MLSEPRTVEIEASRVLWDVYGGTFCSCYNCGKPLDIIDVISEQLKGERDRLAEEAERLGEIQEALRIGRCPKCDHPIFRVSKIVVISSKGEESYLTECHSCGAKLRAVGAKNSSITSLIWTLR